MLQLARRGVTRLLLSLPVAAPRRHCHAAFGSRVDFSRLPTDSKGRRLAPNYFRDHTQSADDILQSIGDADRQRLEQIRSEMQLQLAMGNSLVPEAERLNSYHWLLLLSATSNAMLFKRLAYLARTQFAKDNRRSKKLLRAEAGADRQQQQQQQQQQHRENWQSVFGRISETEIREFYRSGLLHSLPLAAPLVFDMSYHADMSLKALQDLCAQLREVLQRNRESRQPLRLHFCNVAQDTSQYYTLNRSLHPLPPALATQQRQHFEDCLPYEFTPACYTQCYDRKRIVYLSPDARQTMRSFDEDAVYVVGGLVDISGDCGGRSLRKARTAGVRSQKFPMTQSLRSGLPLNIVFDILATWRATGSWREAAACVPTRKLAHSPAPRRRRSYLSAQQQQLPSAFVCSGAAAGSSSLENK